jgi:FixJ family two-component response regulator
MPSATMSDKSNFQDASQTVVVIDDNDLFRQSMEALFQSVGLQTRLFASAVEFLQADFSDTARCIVVDVRMPKMSGLDLQQELAARQVRTPIIIITGHADVPMSVRAMKAGAVDFLTKPFRDQDMIDAVTQALARDSQRRSQSDQIVAIKARYDALTPRERQVMMLVTSGLMNKQSAAKLGLQEITVKLHRASVMKKMAARSLADLVRMTEAIERALDRG